MVGEPCARLRRPTWGDLEFAVTCHAKAHRHEDGRLDDVDYARSLRVLQDAGFTGALAMVNESSRPDGSDEWDGLEQEHEVVRRVFG